ncbi:hypothetical protein JCM19992_15270 [Thermostilla marina]
MKGGIVLPSLMLVFWPAVGAVVGAAEPARPPDRPPAVSAPGESIDELLLRPDETQNTEGVGRASPRVSPPSPQADTSQGRTLEQELGNAAVSEDVDRVIRLLEKMEQVRWRLVAGDPGVKTQDLEREVVQELDRLIDQTQQQCSGSCSNTSQSSTKPSNASRQANTSQTQGTRPGRGTQGSDAVGEDKEPLQQVLESVWGELPERERRRLIQLPPETFLPKYRGMIENYFRRLSEAVDQDR